MKLKSFLGTMEKNKHLMKKYFYVIVITILGTGVWSPAQGKTDNQRGQRGNTEVSMVPSHGKTITRRARNNQGPLGLDIIPYNWQLGQAGSFEEGNTNIPYSTNQAQRYNDSATEST